MALFDTKKYNKSSYKGVPFFTKETGMSGGKNLTVHSFIGRGTKVEENGTKEKSFKINGFLLGEDYLTLKENFRKALDSQGSGLLVDKYYGEIDANVESYEFQESDSKIGKVDFSITFLKVEDNLNVIENESFIKNLGLNLNAMNGFDDSVITKSGFEILYDTIRAIADTYGELSNSLNYLNQDINKMTNNFINGLGVNNFGERLSMDKIVITAFNKSKSTANSEYPATTYKSYTNENSIENSQALKDMNAMTDTIETIINRYTRIDVNNPTDGDLNLANPEKLIDDMLLINDSIETVLDSTTLDENKVKSLVTSLDSILNSAMDRSVLGDNTVNTILFNNKLSFTSMMTIVQLQSIVTRLTDNMFTTGDSFGEFKETVLNIISMLESSFTRQDALNELANFKRDFVNFYTLKYSRLQNLQELNQNATSDIYSICLNRYNNISEIFEVMQNNDIVDPLFINGNIKVI